MHNRHTWTTAIGYLQLHFNKSDQQLSLFWAFICLAPFNFVVLQLRCCTMHVVYHVEQAQLIGSPSTKLQQKKSAGANKTPNDPVNFVGGLLNICITNCQSEINVVLQHQSVEQETQLTDLRI